MLDLTHHCLESLSKHQFLEELATIVMSEATHTATKAELEAQLAKVKARKPEEQEKEKQAALAKVTELQNQQKKLAAEKRDKLLSVQIDRSEAATLAAEFGIAKEAAETVLREQGGNLEAAFNHLLSARPIRPY